jgi:(+)-trans-carveol dehydrogenase
MGRVEGKVALITGAARGQGRSHALRLAAEGADIIAIDICAPVDSNVAAPSTPEDLAETVRQVEGLGRKVIGVQADTRAFDRLKAAVDSGVEALGRLDIVCANAGSWTYGTVAELSEKEFRDVLENNLVGTWHTAKATVPVLVAQEQGGSIVLTSSALGLRGSQNMAHYTAAKHGVVGLMKTMAQELAPHYIRVNCVNPGTVDTELANNPSSYSLFVPDLANPTREVMMERLMTLSLLPVPWVDSVDVSNAVLFLASDEARYITGISLPVDTGQLVK